MGSILIGQVPQSFKIGKLKYEGGGDWYANPSSLPNLFKYIKSNTKMNISLSEETVEPSSSLIFQYPMIYMTGHGNVIFSETDCVNLRKYLLGGGFLLADDNYGLQPFIKRELKKVFPEYDLIELPYNHPIYNNHYKFPKGMPKIHEHDGKPAQGFGIIHEGRLLVFVTYESDLGDGWEDSGVHKDPENKRQSAYQMGVNIINYILTN